MNTRSTASRFFSGLVENVFHAKLGVGDPALLDYLSGLLLRYVCIRNVWRLRTLKGALVTKLPDMLREAENRIGSARQEAFRDIGDHVLFWCGVFPESELGSSERVMLGKFAYKQAFQLGTVGFSPETVSLFYRLSQRFEMCAYGLREVRQAWGEREPNAFGGALIVE